ncbi:MAG TPA: hypothetical protein VE673_18485 [Pseudonocardiaceae bacterium]|nr:hypothetical protein [Pseudonocardiaceae bacterium]
MAIARKRRLDRELVGSSWSLSLNGPRWTTVVGIVLRLGMAVIQ